MVRGRVSRAAIPASYFHRDGTDDSHDYGSLNLSRMDQGKLQLEREYVSMNDLFSHILDRFDMVLQSEAYRDKNYKIQRDLTPRTLWVDIDQDKITQVIDNIMNNALKYFSGWRNNHMSPDGNAQQCGLEYNGRRNGYSA